jgi:hypothetical protein
MDPVRRSSGEYAFRTTQIDAYWVDPEPSKFKALTAIAKPDDREPALMKALEWLDNQPGAPPKPAKSGR